MQCIYALTFYLSFEAFSKYLKHLIKYRSFANLAEVFSGFSLRNGHIIHLGLDLLHVSKCALKGFFSRRGVHLHLKNAINKKWTQTGLNFIQKN